jgi:hypothetical protein
MAGLVPAISSNPSPPGLTRWSILTLGLIQKHHELHYRMDCRVKPGNDVKEW